MNILETIHQVKLQEVAALKQPQRDFVAAITNHTTGVAVIAEYKRASPSEGDIDLVATVEDVVKRYHQAGAAAISVLTDQQFFKGDLSFISRAKAVMPLPVLRKDFIIDPLQVYQSKLAGADAILLIASLLSGEQLLSLSNLAHDLNLQTLVEIHELSELDNALACQPDLLGINARNLTTMTIGMTTNLDTFAEIFSHIPKTIPVVAESGIHTKTDADRMVAAGAKAVLVGTALMRGQNIV